MKKFKIKSYSKVNLYLKVLKKLSNGHHSISSLITFCEPYDVISISINKDSKDYISFSGKFRKKIDKNFNTITKLLYLLRKNNLLKKTFFKININKKIPHGSGLGGGSANAASFLNFLRKKKYLKISKNKINKIASNVGFDVPISLEKKNTFLTGKHNEIIRLSRKFKFNILIVYPNIICSTKKIYKNKNQSKSKKEGVLDFKKNKHHIIKFLKKERNDLQVVTIKLYPKIKKIIDLIKNQDGCYFSRITGSGAACFGIFTNMKTAISTKKLIHTKFPNYWCAVSKTI